MAYIGQGIKNGTFSVLDTSGNTYNGSNTTFNLGTQVGSPAQLIVSHDGVIQKPVTDYTIATGGTQITFTTAPASGASIFITEISGAVGGPMNRDINGDELILDADGDTSITADTDDQIDIRVSGTDQLTIKDGALSPVTDNDIDLGTSSLEFKNVYVDGTVRTDAIDFGTTTMTLPTGDGSANQFIKTDGSGTLSFAAAGGDLSFGGDTFGADKVIGSNDDYTLTFETNNTARLRLDNDGALATLAETAPDADAGGMTVHVAGNTKSMTFKKNSVAHGVTDIMETDTCGRIRCTSSEGGILIEAARDQIFQAIRFDAIIDGFETAKTANGGNGGVEMRVYNKSGSGKGTAAADGNLFCVANGDSMRFIFDEDGDFHADSSSTTFDDYDDAHLARALDLSKGTTIDSKFDKFIAYNHEKLADLKLVGREKDGSPNHFVNVCGMQRLHNGAIWQQYEKHQQLLEAVYDLAKEAVGEEKADAILAKHEVKRLQ